MRLILTGLFLAQVLNAQDPTDSSLTISAPAPTNTDLGDGIINPYYDSEADYDISVPNPQYVDSNDDPFWFNGGDLDDDDDDGKRPRPKPKPKRCPKGCEPRWDHDRDDDDDDDRDWLDRDRDDDDDDRRRRRPSDDDDDEPSPYGRGGLARRSRIMLDRRDAQGPEGFAGSFDWPQASRDRDDDDDDEDWLDRNRDRDDDDDRSSKHRKPKPKPKPKPQPPKCPKWCKPKKPYKPTTTRKPWPPKPTWTRKPKPSWTTVYETSWSTATETETVDPTNGPSTSALPTSGGGGGPSTSALPTGAVWQCPRPCDPSPLLNKCSSSTACVIIRGKGQCLCSAGLRANGISPRDGSQQYRVTDPLYQSWVRVAEGLECTTPCSDSLCTELVVRNDCP